MKLWNTINNIRIYKTLEKPIEALNYFRQAFKIAPTKLKILQNYENVVNQWIPRWHFTMLNDTKRNQAYQNAIEEKIKNGYKRVLDIGTGTGLLSIYAQESGAEAIFACETNEIMLDIAANVFKSMNNIVLLPKHSTEINRIEFGENEIDLIVTEIFDSGAFGEGMLSTLLHAKENLISPNGKIIPEKINIYVIGVDGINVDQKQLGLKNTLENSIYMKHTLLTVQTDEPYDTPNCLTHFITVTTAPVLALSVDFNDLNSLKNASNGILDREVQLTCFDDGILEGFLVYFELYLDDNNILKNFDSQSYKKTHNQLNCWDPIIFPLLESLEVKKYETLKVFLSCKNGILKLTHDYCKNSAENIQISPELYSFLADEEFIYELEYNVNKVLEKSISQKFSKFADFFPFPHTGINLLKEHKIETLYCLEKIRKFVEEIAEWNLIKKSSIKFVDSLDNLVNDQIKFDLILLQPITNHGTLNEDQLKYYHALKKHCLNINGLIFPYKIDICGKIIQSNWLNKVTKVENNELNKYGIVDYMNNFATTHHYDYNNIDSIDLSEIFTISKVHFDNKYHESYINVNLTSSKLSSSGIIYYYKIFFRSSSIPVLTNHKKSFCKVNCFIQNIDLKNRSSVKIRFRQNEFVFRCNIED